MCIGEVWVLRKCIEMGGRHTHLQPKMVMTHEFSPNYVVCPVRYFRKSPVQGQELESDAANCLRKQEKMELITGVKTYL